MIFLELRQEPGTYSRVMVGMALQKSCMFSDIRTPVYLRGTAWDSPRGMEAQQGPLSRGVGGPRFLSTSHRDIGIPINFQEKSAIF